MSDAIRVLLADDSAVARRLVREVLDKEPGIELVAAAPDGEVALRTLADTPVDLVLLDVEMPRMDGLTTLKAIRRDNRALPVLMFSALTERGAGTTLDALAAGASDYLAKPRGSGLDEIRQYLSRELVPRIRQLVPRGPRAQPGRAVGRTEPTHRIELVVIGISTGGPPALREVIGGLPPNLAVPVVIVQHMPEQFTGLLSERLDQTCEINVAEAKDGEFLHPGTVRIARGGIHLVVKKGPPLRLGFDDGPPEQSCKPAADVLFRSAAKALGPRVLGVVLTGMGADGALGSRFIKDAGGHILAQDQATSVVYGMPRAVAEAGLVSQVLPLNQVAPEIVRRVNFQRLRVPA